jgi:ABC-2 type transport system permease protein
MPRSDANPGGIVSSVGPTTGPGATIPRLLRVRWWGFRNRWRKAERGHKWAYGLFALCTLIFWLGLCFGLFKLVGAFHAVEVFGPLLTKKLLEILLLALFFMLIFSNVVTALSTFYLSADLELLLALPIARPVFHYARLSEAVIQSSWMMLMFGMPVFLAYGMVYGAGPLFYALLLILIPAFLLIPGAMGVILASVLVNVFPARRAREVMALLGLMALVGLFMLLRIVRPEQLVDAEGFESLAAYVATVQAPMAESLPPQWLSLSLLNPLQGKGMAWTHAGLLLSCAGAGLAVSRWITQWLYRTGWSKTQEASTARLAKSNVFSGVLNRVGDWLPRDIGAILVKDVRCFFRDPAQWSQVLILVSLIVIYLFSVKSLPVDVVHGAYMQGFKNALAFLNLGMAGFVMAGIAIRFQFTAVSSEGRAFWMVQSGPIHPVRFLWAKAIPGFVPMLIVGLTLVLASNAILDSPPALVWVEGATTVVLALGISGIAVGMGAMFPNFKADTAAKVAAGPAGILFMVVSLSLIAVVMLLEALPMWFILRAQFMGGSLSQQEWMISAFAFVLATVVCLFAAVWPVRKAAKGLWARG